MGGHGDGASAAQILAEELCRHHDNIALGLEGAKHRYAALAHGAGACYATAAIARKKSGTPIAVEGYSAGDTLRIVVRNGGWWQAIRKLLQRPPDYAVSPHESLLEELAQMGSITRADMLRHAWRGKVSNCLTASQNNPRFQSVTVKEGDTVVLVSDGVTENMPIEQVAWRSAAGDTMQLLHDVWEETEMAMKDADKRRNAGANAKRDNRSIVVMEVR